MPDSIDPQGSAAADTHGDVNAVVCVDFGSTFTKALLVELSTGEVLAATSHPTTIRTDVLDGYDACIAALSATDARAETAPALACSSAGGGLRIAVVGNEALVTAEAGRRVALSSGGKVVAVIAVAGEESPAALVDAELADAQPDVILLTGGTDGGNLEALLSAARAIAEAAWAGPVVVAGNVDGQPEVAAVLGAQPHVMADNVVPRIGVLAPDSARAAIREMFLEHVIGGKHLSARADFREMVKGATPDVVLTGVELLARGSGEHAGAGDVVVVDIGGATTDVHSVVEVDPDTGLTTDGLAREVVATTPVTRTVEGDLGMRWSARTTVEEGISAGLLGDVPDEHATLRAAGTRRQADPDFLPDSAEESALDEQIARAAAGLALRRHAGRSKVVLSPEGRVVERSGKDLREVDLVVGSGGVLRHGDPGDRPTDIAQRVLAPHLGEQPGGWQLPRSPRVVIDREYVLAAAGLLADRYPDTAFRLVRRLVRDAPSDQPGHVA